MLNLLFLTLLFSAAPGGAARCTTTTPFKKYRNCLTLPTQSAALAWTYHPHNATLDVAFTGTFISPSGWVAWGLNPSSPEMTGTRALVAFSDPTSGALVLLPYILDSSVKLQRSPLASRPLDIPLLASSASLTHSDASIHSGDTVFIHATLKLPSNKTTINHVWNRGLFVQGYSPTIHGVASGDLASRARLNVAGGTASTAAAPPGWLRPLHGMLNAVSWGFLLPCGAAVARYLRPVGPAWYYAHAMVQGVGFLLGAAGFATGLVMGAASEGVVYGLHRGLGVTAFCAGAVQAAALLFRPKTTHRYRRYWKSYHHLVGYGCVVVGVVNVFQGMDVMGIGRSYAKLVYCLALATMMGTCVAMEVNAWVLFSHKAEEEKLAKREVAEEGGSGVVVKGRVSY